MVDTQSMQFIISAFVSIVKNVKIGRKLHNYRYRYVCVYLMVLRRLPSYAGCALCVNHLAKKGMEERSPKKWQIGKPVTILIIHYSWFVQIFLFCEILIFRMVGEGSLTAHKKSLWLFDKNPHDLEIGYETQNAEKLFYEQDEW